MGPQEEKERQEFSSFMEADQPSMRFTKNVMEAIEDLEVAPTTKQQLNNWVVKGIAASLIGMVLVLCGYAYTHADGIQLGTPKIAAYINWTSNAALYIVGANIVLLLALADRLLGRKNRINAIEKNA